MDAATVWVLFGNDDTFHGIVDSEAKASNWVEVRLGDGYYEEHRIH